MNPIVLLSRGWAQTRRGWRKLISMRTALVLLFLLAIASVPGSLLPQRNLNPSKVDAYLGSHHDQDLGDDSVLEEDFDKAVAQEDAELSKEQEAAEAYADSVRAQEGDEN